MVFIIVLVYQEQVVTGLHYPSDKNQFQKSRHNYDGPDL